MANLLFRLCTAISVMILVSNLVLRGSCTDEILDHKCTNETDCVSPNSTCIDGTCVCKEGFIEVVYPSRCLPVPESKEERCEDDNQCTEAFTLGSFCGEGGFCDCHPNYHFSGGLCLRNGTVVIVMHHAAVFVLVSCVLVCRGQQQGGFPPPPGFAIQPVTQGDQPGFPRQPPPSPAPYNNTRNLTQPIQGDSLRPDESGPGAHLPGRPLGGIDDRCTQDRECAVEGSYCKDGQFCSCEEDKAASKDHKRCLSMARKLNDRCEEDIQCTENLQLGAQCKAGTCQCREQHHYAELRGQNGCYKTKKVGDVCNIVNECTSKPDPLRVSCNAVCECNTPYKPTEDKMLCGTSGKTEGSNGSYLYFFVSPGSSAVLGGMIALVASCLLAKLVQ
ncbi:hypothetical protein B566_EDAN002863 [Ephemera danica]|nr:hypothetical protein B566_EDAN002863 [Ephemera danica]